MRTLQSIIVILAIALGSTALAAPTFAPAPLATPHEKAYSTWAALWWQWALQTPADVNPVTDTTGAHCAVNQPVPGTFFLAGALGGGTINRTCTVPVGTAFLIPILNKGYFAQQTDPPNQRTEAFVRSQVTCVEQSPTLSLTVDGVSLANPISFLEKSDLFSVNLPPNNIFGAPAQLLSPSADEGYYSFVEPLAPGSHTVHIVSSGCDASEDVTYALTVQGTVGNPISCSGFQTLNLSNVDIQTTGVAITVSGNCNVQISNSVIWGQSSGIVIHDQGHVIVNSSVVGGGTSSFSADGHGHGEYRNSTRLGPVVTGPFAIVSDSGGNVTF